MFCYTSCTKQTNRPSAHSANDAGHVDNICIHHTKHIYMIYDLWNDMTMSVQAQLYQTA